MRLSAQKRNSAQMRKSSSAPDGLGAPRKPSPKPSPDPSPNPSPKLSKLHKHILDLTTTRYTDERDERWKRRETKDRQRQTESTETEGKMGEY